jgi:lipopolysaccharide assembly outer membrane protein LptD (OstA)
MSIRLSAWRPAAAAALFALASPSPGQSNAPAAGPDLSAKELDLGGGTNWTRRAKGDVWVRYAGHELHCDEAELNDRTGDVRARGHVELHRAGMGRWLGDEINYNYITRAGLIGAGEVRAGPVTIRSGEGHRDPDGTLVMTGARMTTCTNDESRWHYWVSANRVRYREHDRVTGYGATTWFEGLPLFWTPYLTRDVNDPFGPRLFPGYRSGWGAFLLSTYTHPLGPDGLDGSVLLDYRSRRGLGYGYELDWRHDVLGNGRLGLYGTDDRDANDPRGLATNRVERERWRLYLDHQADPTPRDQVLVRGDILSDVRMNHDFFPAVYRDNSQPDNFAAYTHRGLDYAAGLGASGPLNPFYDGVIRAPEAWVSILPQELLAESGLYYESDTRASFLRQQWAVNDHSTNSVYEPYAFRLDSRHQLTYPLQAFDFLNVVPRAAYRYTFYSHLADGRTNEIRHAVEFGVESSFRAWRTYGEYRHVVQPYLDYAVVAAPSVRPFENYFYDRRDGPREWRDYFGIDGDYPARRWHGVRPGVRNELQVRDADGSVRTVFDWDAFVACRFGNAEPGTASNGVALFGSSLIFRPVRGVRLQSGVLVDPEDGRIDTADSRLMLGEGARWQLEIEHYLSEMSDPASLHANTDPLLSTPAMLARAELLRAAVTHRLTSSLSGCVFVRYDLEDSELNEVGGYGQYDLDCLSFRLATGYLPAYTRSDGSRRAADWRIGFEMWVKALEPGKLDKMRGW